MIARLVVTVLAGLVVIGVVHAGPVRLGLEDQLADRAAQALADAGATGVAVEVSGLEARVTGSAAAPEDATDAVDAVLAVDGIAVVEASVDVVVTQPPPDEDPTAPDAGDPAGQAGAGDPDAGLAAAELQRTLDELGPVTFVPNSAVLTEESLLVVQQVAAAAATAPDTLRLRIEAHTDTVGPPDANRSLSVDRASAVRIALRDLGVPWTRMQAVGYGEERPLVTPEVTLEDRAANRRVEVVVVP